MKKTRESTRKSLRLNAETIRDLRTSALVTVLGGGVVDSASTCNIGYCPPVSECGND